MKRFLLGTSASVVLLASGASAWAQTEQGIETVTVTAQKRAESAQNVPIALTVLSAEDLKNLGITKVNGLQYATPSLEIVPAFGSGQPEFRLRGVGFDDYASNNSSTVGVYVDEVAYPIPAQTQGTIFSGRKFSTDRKVRSTASTRRPARSTSSPTSRPTRSPSV